MQSVKRKLRETLQINIKDLRMGMFVAELDRPWANSPFMIQGFLLTEVLDFKTLEGMVSELTIDLARSDQAALKHISWDSLYEPVTEETGIAEEQQPGTHVIYSEHGSPLEQTNVIDRVKNSAKQLSDIFNEATAPNTNRPGRAEQLTPSASGQPAPYFLRYSDFGPDANSTNQPNPSTPPSTLRFSEFIAQLYPRDVIYAPLNLIEKIQYWLSLFVKPTSANSTRQRNHFPKKKVHPNYIDPDINLVIYRNHTPIQAEIPQARVAIERTQIFLASLATDMLNGKELDLQQLKPAVQLLSESVIANPSALMWLMRMQTEDIAIYSHGLKVAVYMMAMGRHLGFARQQLNDLGLIGLLLDVGKLNLPDELMNKPGKLSEEEIQTMRNHVENGISKLEHSEPLSQSVYLGIIEHHERMDGSGYPQGLEGAAISIYGRMAAIADSFSAMTSHRTYDATRSAFDAMKELFKLAGTKLHAPLVEEFVQAIGIFPVGTLIALSTGEVAIVLDHNRLRRLEPKILILTDSDKSLLESPKVVNLMGQDKLAQDDSTRIRILHGLPDGAYGIDSRSYYQTRT